MDNQTKPNSIPNQSASDRSARKDSRKLAWFIAALILITTLLLLCILPGSPALGVFLKLPQKAQPVVTKLDPIAFDPVSPPGGGGPANIEFPVGSSITVDVPPDLTRPRPRPRPAGGRRTPDCITIAIDNVTNITTADPCPTSSTPKPPAPTTEPPVGFPKPKILDFGDAPDDSVDPSIDGHFPSLLSSNGARHINIKRFYLGKRVDLEKDSNQVDKDSPLIPPGLDDGTLYAFLNPIIGAGFGFSGFLVEIHNNDWPEENPIYLNGLYDTNFNKHWEAPEEHIIVDKEFHIPPGQSAWYLVPFITNIDFLHWLRLTVTDIPLGEGYDGSWPEAFAYGETEDYIKLILPPPPRSGVYHREKDSSRTPPTDEPTYTPGSPGSATFDPHYWEQVIVPGGVSGLRALRDNLGFKAGDFIVVQEPGIPGTVNISRSTFSITLPTQQGGRLGVTVIPVPPFATDTLIRLKILNLQREVAYLSSLPTRPAARIQAIQKEIQILLKEVLVPVPIQPTPIIGGVATQYKIEVVSVNTGDVNNPAGYTEIRAIGHNDGNNAVIFTARSKSGTVVDVRSIPFNAGSLLLKYIDPPGAASIQAHLEHNGDPVPGVIANFTSVGTITASGGGGGPVTSGCTAVTASPSAVSLGTFGQFDDPNITITFSGGTLPYTISSQAPNWPPVLNINIGATTVTLDNAARNDMGVGLYDGTFRVVESCNGTTNFPKTMQVI